MIDYDNELFNIKISGEAPQQGSLLVAEPFLKDEHFAHSVICLIEYSHTGTAMGIVLNRQTQYKLGELVNNVNTKSDIPIFCGGPMSHNRLYFIHRLGNLIPDSREIAKGLYIGGNFDAITEYINDGMPVEGMIRFFVGYSGWDRNQLDEELSQNVWAVTKIPDLKTILTGSEDVFWHRMVRSMGHKYRGWLYHPANPQWN